jgi:NAD(P)-dependent dehydrogenase (short-subunit alcohol dehydrogenase family)
MAQWLILGASRGIGLALARHIIARGESCTATCRAPSPALEASGVRVEAGVDLTDNANLAALDARLGDLRIDRLLVVAGQLAREGLDELDDAAFARIESQFQTNALGPLRAVAAVKHRLAPGARIGLLTSRMGSIADNSSGGYYGYRASKAALNAIGKSLAEDLRPCGVAVFLLHPGFVRTDMTGGQGDVDADTSACNLLARMDSLDLAQSGTFWHANGQPLPW